MKFNSRCISIMLIAASLSLAGCKQSPEDRIYEAFKCGKAATLLGHEKEAAQAIAAVESDLQAIAGESGMGRYAMTLSERFQEDVPLYRYSAGDQIAALKVIFETDTCQGLYAPPMLDLSSEAPQAAAPPDEGGTQAPTTNPQTGRPTTPAAVLKIGRDYVADAQSALLPTSVIAYCKAFASVLQEPRDLQDCLRLAEMPRDLTSGLRAPESAEALFAQAAKLPAMQRFAVCTSDQALRFIASVSDYETCMPPELDGQLQRLLGDAKSTAEEAAGVGPPAFPYNDPLGSASQLSAEERVAYCGIPAVAGQLEGEDQANCLNGIDPAAQTFVPAPADPTDIAVDPFAVLSNASQMNSQAQRDALCNRVDVKAVLTAVQYRDCVVGLSPNDPPQQVLTDDDPGYRDDGG